MPSLFVRICSLILNCEAHVFFATSIYGICHVLNFPPSSPIVIGLGALAAPFGPSFPNTLCANGDLLSRIMTKVGKDYHEIIQVLSWGVLMGAHFASGGHLIVVIMESSAFCSLVCASKLICKKDQANAVGIIIMKQSMVVFLHLAIEKRVWFEAILVLQPVVVAAVSMCFTQEELYKMMNVGILCPTNPRGILLPSGPRGILLPTSVEYDSAHSDDQDYVQLVGHDEVTGGGEFGHDSDYSDDEVGQAVSVGNLIVPN
ncbi:hypothetical protein HHK36_008711 [Tetracentron sinense]|uniref:Uncharacterized protein n=1 Tax=Tetracentron sinense TaxID=13715 RepID=A0A835DK91_TETSI|nr:hypothetical protein HHK36_008711 [Tetracentron sinense]